MEQLRVQNRGKEADTMIKLDDLPPPGRYFLVRPSKDEFFEQSKKYVDLAKDVLTRPSHATAAEREPKLYFISNEGSTLRDLVRRAEATETLRDLRDAFGHFWECEDLSEGVDQSLYGYGEYDFDDLCGATSDARICNFFRRSGSYHETFFGENIDTQDLFDLLYSESTKSHVITTYLIPLCGVKFFGEGMDFGTFSIRRYTSNDLRALLGNEANSWFYTAAYLPTKTLEKLEQ